MKAILLTAASTLALYSALLASATDAFAATGPAASVSSTALGPVDTYFATQTALGTPFQVDAGRVAEVEGTTEAIRSYADLMVSSHITVNDALLAILRNKRPVPPPTLLKAAYSTIVSTLQNERGRVLDADYVRGQVYYQEGNGALYEYEIAHGTDPDLKAFAQATLPKILDHLDRALKVQSAAD
jgi:putative membrane protein